MFLILEEAVSLSFHDNTLEKAMNLSILLQAIDKW